jgi:hypothetical protein
MVAALAVALVIGPSPQPASATTQDGDPVIAAAGDIACRRPTPNVTRNKCYQRATSDLILSDPTIDSVLALGDEQYPCGSLANFMKGYDPTWGRLKSVTHPVVGNHEVQATESGCDTAASGYFQYFGGAAQPNGANGYYSFDITGTGSSTASWRVIVLNANCGLVSCSAGSPQEQFLASKLASAPQGSCIMAAWHQPRFTGAKEGPVAATLDFWKDLEAADAALILNGHAHYYERFAPQDRTGAATPDGITEIIAGTGGASHGHARFISPNTEYYTNQHYGALFLTLGDGSYSWEFKDVDGTVLDSGSAPCTKR